MKTRKKLLILLIGIVLAGLTFYAFGIIQRHNRAKNDLQLKILLTRFFEQMPVLSEDEKKNLGIDFLEIYGPDDTGEKVKVSGYVAVSRNFPLEGKLKLLIGQLSEKQFDKKPMALTKIERRGMKKIAMIDIIDPKDPTDERSWFQSFQGSTGGSITQQKLLNTLLQANYLGEWIDAIDFTYNGEPFEEWDHINLSGTQTR